MATPAHDALQKNETSPDPIQTMLPDKLTSLALFAMLPAGAFATRSKLRRQQLAIALHCPDAQ
jgi:hypothetical protein